MIKIGHASGDERGKASGGNAGDQTGRELRILDWYSSPWDTVLRFKDSAKAEKAAKAMEAACANNNIGYDQIQRNTLNSKAKAVGYDLAKVTEKCETDCSALVSVCAQAAGIDIPYTSGNAPWTGNMRSQFTKTGEFEVLTDSKYLTSDAYLKRGDILLRTSGHTAMALENGSAKDTNVPTKPAAVTTMTALLPLLKKGCEGEGVEALQVLLNHRGYNCGEVDGEVDGEFGSKTDKALKAFQSAKKLEADGVCGRLSWQALIG